MLNHDCGLKGICGEHDMRTIIKNSRSVGKAKLAFELFCYRVRQYIGKYFVTLGGADAIVFTAGIGENSAEVREEICKGLECLGIKIDVEKNKNAKDKPLRKISTEDSQVMVLVVDTNEELQIVKMGKELFAKE